MLPRLLLDTHILIRWFSDARRLTREQLSVLRRAARRHEPMAFSAITLLEIAGLIGEGRLDLKMSLDEFLGSLRTHSDLLLIPISYEVASEIRSLMMIKDPSDRAIVATARVHRLRLVTSDQRIIDSRLVSVVD